MFYAINKSWKSDSKFLLIDHCRNYQFYDFVESQKYYVPIFFLKVQFDNCFFIISVPAKQKIHYSLCGFGFCLRHSTNIRVFWLNIHILE